MIKMAICGLKIEQQFVGRFVHILEIDNLIVG